MKTKSVRNLFSLLALAGSLFSYALTSPSFVVQAETGDTHQLLFGGVDFASELNPNGAQKGGKGDTFSAASDGSVLTITANTTGNYFSSFTEVQGGKTYIVTGEVLMPKLSGVVVWVNDVWDAHYETTVSESDATEYVPFSFSYAPSSDTKAQILIQITYINDGLTHDFKFKNLFLAEQKSVTEGSQIGTLPSLPSNDLSREYDYWTIDGEKIDESTIYSYSTDKFALPHVTRKYGLTFSYGQEETSPNLFPGSSCDNLEAWNAGSAGSNLTIIEEGRKGKAFRFASSSSKQNYFQSIEFPLFANSTYELSFDIRVTNASKDLSFSTFLAGSSALGWNDMFTDPFQKDTDWATIHKTFDVPTDTSLSSSAFLGFKFYSGSGTVDIDEVTLRLVHTTRYLKEGEKLSSLPALPTKKGYTAQCWMVDGTDLTEGSSIYSWTENKTATVRYEASHYRLSFALMDYLDQFEAITCDENMTKTKQGDELVFEASAASSFLTPAMTLPKTDQYLLKGEAILSDGLTLEISSDASITASFTPLSGVASFEFPFSLSQEEALSFRLTLNGKGSVSFSSFVLIDKTLEKEVSYGAEIGELPSFAGAPEGKIVTWRMKGEKLLPSTHYSLTGDALATLSYEFESHFVSFVANGETILQEEIRYGEPLGKLPLIASKEGFESHWKWNNQIVDETTPFNSHEDIVIEWVETPITYTATFVVDGQSVATVPFTVLDTSLPEPEIPAKKGYHAAWAPYTIEAHDMTIEAIYTQNIYYLTIRNDRYGAIVMFMPIHYGDTFRSVLNDWPSITLSEDKVLDHWEMNGKKIELDDTFLLEDDASLYPVFRKEATPLPPEEKPVNENGYANGLWQGTLIGVGGAVVLGGIAFSVLVLTKRHTKKKGSKQ